MVVVTGAAVLVVVEAPTVDVDDVGGGEVELVQAASGTATTTVTTITTSLAHRDHRPCLDARDFQRLPGAPAVGGAPLRSGGPTPERPSTSHFSSLARATWQS